MNRSSKAILAKKVVESYGDPGKSLRCFIGFDGFTDEIIDVVRTRRGLRYERMERMSDLSGRIADFAGKSCNVELVVRERKIGGNAPILANALLEGRHRIIFAGAIGTKEKIESLFQGMASRCEGVFPLGASGHSDAMEFNDGKVIFGKYETLFHLDYDYLLGQIGKSELIRILDASALFVSANWTMLPGMTGIWEGIAKEIVPQLSKGPRWLFVDLADPAKRTDEDIAGALKALKGLGEGFKVILGLNHAEALRVGKVLGSSFGDTEDFEKLGKEILKRSGLHQILLHSAKQAASVTEKESALVETVYAAKPKLTTGAGDNFNAGFCNGLLYGFSMEECLLMGIATAGFYVRNGRSPNMDDVSQFLVNWENGKL